MATQQLNKKGFTLPELLVVMVVISILAATSTPFVKGYIRDSRNGRAKAALVQVGEAYKNFKTDYPSSALSSGQLTAETRSTCGTYSQIKASESPDILVNCRYLAPMKWSSMKYKFFIGSSNSCSGAYGDVIAYIQGNDGGNYCAEYFACFDEYGKITDNKDTACSAS